MRSKYLLIMILLPLLCGCSFITQFYIVNKTDYPVKVDIYFDHIHQDSNSMQHPEQWAIRTTKKKIKVRLDAYEKFRDSTIIVKSGNKASLIMQPMSTTFLGHGFNTYLSGIEKIIFYEKDTTVVIAKNQPIQYKHRGLRLAWYEVEQQKQL